MVAASQALNPLSFDKEAYPFLTEIGVHTSTHQFHSYDGFCTKLVLSTDDCDYIFECSPAVKDDDTSNVRHRMHELQPLLEDPLVLKVIENGYNGTARCLLRAPGLVLVNTLELGHVVRLLKGGDTNIEHAVSACASSGVRGGGYKVKSGKIVSAQTAHAPDLVVRARGP